MTLAKQGRFIRVLVLFVAVAMGGLFFAPRAEAQVTAFKQAVAEAAASDRDIAAFYKANNYKPG